MVPFPAALCAAGTPMGWTLVAPFLELPPSCAALAALANRARPAVRCRTAFPQKCRDWGGVGGAFYASDRTEGIVTPDDFSLVPPGGTVSFCKKEMVGPKAPLLEGERSAAFGAQGKARAALRQNRVRLRRRKEMVGPKAPLLEGVKSAALGRIKRFGRACGAE